MRNLTFEAQLLLILLYVNFNIIILKYEFSFIYVRYVGVSFK